MAIVDMTPGTLLWASPALAAVGRLVVAVALAGAALWVAVGLASRAPTRRHGRKAS